MTASGSEPGDAPLCAWCCRFCALEPIRDQYVTLATVGVPLAAPVPHLPARNALLLGTWWLSLVEVGCLRTLAVFFSRVH